MKSQTKKIIAILLAVCFISSLTAIAVSAKPTEAKYQDVAWLKSVVKYSKLIVDDCEKVQTDVNNSDYSALSTDLQKTVNDMQKALDENAKYRVSPKYQKAQKEWKAGLYDYRSSFKYFIQGLNDAKKGTLNPKAMEKATRFIDAGGVHFMKASALIKAGGK